MLFLLRAFYPHPPEPWPRPGNFVSPHPASCKYNTGPGSKYDVGQPPWGLPCKIRVHLVTGLLPHSLCLISSSCQIKRSLALLHDHATDGMERAAREWRGGWGPVSGFDCPLLLCAALCPAVLGNGSSDALCDDSTFYVLKKQIVVVCFPWKLN